MALVRDARITRHVAQVEHRKSAVDGRNPGHEVSLIRRRLTEGCSGRIKTIGNFRRTRFRGVQQTNLVANLTAAAQNLVRMKGGVTPESRRLGSATASAPPRAPAHERLHAGAQAEPAEQRDGGG